MFKYTRSAIDVIKEKVTKFLTVVNYVILVFTTLYFIYALIARTGVFIINLILAILFAAYTIFDFVSKKVEMGDAKKIVSRVYGYVKIILKVISVLATLYSIVVASEDVKPLSIILATLMIVLVVLQFALQIIGDFVKDVIEVIYTAATEDVEEIKKPVTTVSNFFKKMTNQDIEEPKPKNTRVLDMLDKAIQEKKAKEENERQEKKNQEKNNVNNDKKKITPTVIQIQQTADEIKEKQALLKEQKKQQIEEKRRQKLELKEQRKQEKLALIEEKRQKKLALENSKHADATILQIEDTKK